MKTLLYPFYILIFVLSAWRIQHYNYVHHLKTEQPVAFLEMQTRAKISQELLNSIGSISTEERQGRYLFFDSVKKSNVLRVGVLGGSDSFGLEVRSGLDYPAQLQTLLKKHGFPQVEVINFASGGWGFHQTFRFWDQFARGFDLDFLLLGPTWFANRDSTFNYGTPFYPYNIHGRYILDGNKLKFIDVIGSGNFEDRFENYFQFIPHATYLHYDRRPPSALQCLFFGDKEFKNPFYYFQKPLEEEWAIIHEKLLEKMTEGPEQILYSEMEEEPPPPARKIPKSFVNFKFPTLQSFPYWRVAHPSAFGHALIAKMYLDILTRKNEIKYPLLHFAWIPNQHAADSLSLNQFEEGLLQIENRNIGILFYAQDLGQREEQVNFKRDGIKALVGLSNKPEAKFQFVALDFEIGSDEKIDLITDKKERVSIGSLEIIHRAPDIARIRTPGHDEPLQEYLNKLVEKWGSFHLAIGDHVFYGVEKNHAGIHFKPAWRKAIEARPESDTFFEVESLPKDGELTLNLIGDKSIQVKLANWMKTEQTLKYDNSSLKRYLHR